MEHRSLNDGRFALSLVALAAACLMAGEARAFGLGRLAVQSTLGEPLKAEIEVTSLNADEASSLRLRVAAPETYRNAGIEYNPVLQGAQVSLQRRADGRPYLSVVSDRPVLEPFMDVILESTWASGRVVRNYTLLIDPPNLRQAAAASAPVTPVTPVVIAAAPPQAPRASAVAPAPRSAGVEPATPRPVQAVSEPRPRPAAAPAADQYAVRPGDSLSRIATRTQREGVSLDQMLVSLFRGNPSAFMDNNMNRLKAGSVLAVPSAEAARQLSPGQAHAEIVAQSNDFGAYRQRLAAGVSAAPPAESARQSGGKVQARVEERPLAATASPDKLTLSPGAAKPEAVAPPADPAKDTAARVAELKRNIAELERLQSAAASAVPATQASPAAPVVVAAASVAASVAPASAASQVAVASVPASAVAPTQAPASAAAARKPLPPVPAPAAEPNFLATLLDSPWLLPAGGVLLAILAGLGFYRLRRRTRTPSGETSFFDSHPAADSFFGAPGGQHIDTAEKPAAPALMEPPPSRSTPTGFSISQLDVIGEVDAVAEADVYLAYGRDLQAEEILKEALRSTPERMAIRTKLLEVYAKRRDTKGFELLAGQLYAMTRGDGEHWSKAQELGRQLDPENPLYAPGGKPELVSGPTSVEPLGASTMPLSVMPTPSAAASARLGLAEVKPLPMPNTVDLALDLDFDAPPPPPVAPPPAAAPASSARPRAMAAEPETHQPLEFDLGDLSLDLDAPLAAPAPASAKDAGGTNFADFSLDDGVAGGEAALSRKLDLAEEFIQIGDTDGARDLIEEVLAKATGALKIDAQALLDRLH